MKEQQVFWGYISEAIKKVLKNSLCMCFYVITGIGK